MVTGVRSGSMGAMSRHRASRGHRTQPPAGRLGQVLVAGPHHGGSGLPVGTTRRHPTWGLTFVTAGTGRYRDAAHDEPIGPGTLVVVHPGHPHWYGADPRRVGRALRRLRRRRLRAGPAAVGRSPPTARSCTACRSPGGATGFAAFGEPAATATASRRATPRPLDLLAALLEATRHPRARGGAATPTPAGWTRSVELLDARPLRAARPGVRGSRGRHAVRDVAAPVPRRHGHQPICPPRRATARGRDRPARAHGSRRAGHRGGNGFQRRAAPDPTFRRATGLTPRAFRDAGR